MSYLFSYILRKWHREGGLGFMFTLQCRIAYCQPLFSTAFKNDSENTYIWMGLMIYYKHSMPADEQGMENSPWYSNYFHIYSVLPCHYY